MATTTPPRKPSLSFLSNQSPGSRSPPVFPLTSSSPSGTTPISSIPASSLNAHTFLSNRPPPPSAKPNTKPPVDYTPPPPNSLAFTTIPVSSVPRAQSFYESVFDWKFSGPSGIFFTPAKTMGALVKTEAVEEAGKKAGTVNYVLVSDVAGTLERVVEAGGKVEKEVWVEGGHTEMALYSDCEGNVGGLLKWLI